MVEEVARFLGVEQLVIADLELTGKGAARYSEKERAAGRGHRRGMADGACMGLYVRTGRLRQSPASHYLHTPASTQALASETWAAATSK